MHKARSYLGLRISATRFAYEVFFHFPSLTHFYKKACGNLQPDLRRNATRCMRIIADLEENFKCFLKISG